MPKKKKKKESDKPNAEIDDDPSTEAKRKGYYFDNHKVEQLLMLYVADGCVDVKMRDEIMSHAAELIRQIIRTHNFHNIYPGSDDASFNDLFQVAWCQIESTLYKFDSSPGHTKVFNMWCVAPDTTLLTSGGVITIGDIEDNACSVIGIDGLNKINAFVRKNRQETIKIKTLMGYELECTPMHRVMVQGREWARAAELEVGDLIPVQFDNNYFVGCDDISDIDLESRGKWQRPDNITEELAYIIGLFIAEGSYSYNKLVIYNTEDEVISSLLNNTLGLNFIHEPQFQRISLCCKRFIELLIKLGFGETTRAYTKSIPQRLTRLSKNVMSSMLRGVFDSDGHSSRHNGCVGYTSTSKTLIDQLRVILLNYGLLTKLSVDDRCASGKATKSKRTAYQITCPTEFSSNFYKNIGFGIQRKQNKATHLKKDRQMLFGVIPHLQALYSKYGPGDRGYDDMRHIIRNKSGMCTIDAAQKINSWDRYSDDGDYIAGKKVINDYLNDGQKTVWLPIVSMEQSENEVCEISVDSDSHSYLANGIVTHNSQVAKTVMLAHIKRETRDKKNYKSYKRHLDTKSIRKSIIFDRFLSEAKEICVDEDSIVFSKNGIIKAKEAKIGDYIYGSRGLSKIKAVRSIPYVPSLKITTNYGYTSTMAKNHQLVRINKRPEWVAADRLAIGQRIAIQMPPDHSWSGEDKDKDFAYIVGLIIAEGTILDKRVIITNTDRDIEKFLLSKPTGLKFIHKGKDFILNSKSFVSLLDKIGLRSGLRSHTKSIPDAILRMNKPSMAAVLSGMFDGDGYARNDGKIIYTTTSLELARRLKIVLLAYGILTYHKVIPASHREFPTGVYNTRQYYRILLSASDSRRFYDQIGFRIKRKQKRQSYLPNSCLKISGLRDAMATIKEESGLSLRGLQKAGVPKSAIYSQSMTVNSVQSIANSRLPEELIFPFCLTHDSNIFWDSVVKIEPVAAKLINIETESSTFTSDGFLTHNCKYNREHVCILEALRKLYDTDNKPHEGLIGKVVTLSGLSRTKVSNFLRQLRLRSLEFTDAPANEELEHKDGRVKRSHKTFEEEDYD